MDPVCQRHMRPQAMRLCMRGEARRPPGGPYSYSVIPEPLEACYLVLQLFNDGIFVLFRLRYPATHS